MTTVETTWPLSIWQRQCMADEQVRAGVYRDPFFTISTVVELDRPLDLVVLRRALDELLRRHEILRTRFVEDAQVVTPNATAGIEEVNEVDVYFPVSPDSPTPVALTVAGTALSLHLHHLACDPVTLWAALAELGALYGAELGGPAVPPPSAQFGEYVLQELERERADKETARAWWQAVLGGKRFARVHPDPTAAAFAFRDELLSAEAFSALESTGRRLRGTTLTTLTAALACAMHPHVSDGDLLFSTIFRKRDRPQWQRMLGPAFAPTTVAVPAPPDRLTPDYTRAVRDHLLRCQRHNRYDIVELRSFSPDLAAGPSLRTFFEFIPADRPADIAFGPVTGRVVTAAGPRMMPSFALSIRSRDTPEGNVVGHLSGIAGGWRESAVRGLWTAVADLVRDA